MIISSAAPNGAISTLNLGLLPAWRLEIIAEVNGRKEPSGRLGVGIRYVIPPTTTFAYIAAIDTRAIGGETEQIAAKGLPYGEHIEDKEAFIESLQMLSNAEGLKKKDIDEILKDAPGLVDIYYDILKGLRSGKGCQGSFLDWRWHLRPDITGLQFVKIGLDGPDTKKLTGESEGKESED